MAPAYRPITIYKGAPYSHTVSFVTVADGVETADTTTFAGRTWTADIQDTAGSTVGTLTVSAGSYGTTGQITITATSATTGGWTESNETWNWLLKTDLGDWIMRGPVTFVTRLSYP